MRKEKNPSSLPHQEGKISDAFEQVALLRNAITAMKVYPSSFHALQKAPSKDGLLTGDSIAQSQLDYIKGHILPRHDIFHTIGNEVFKKLCEKYPEKMEEYIKLYKFNTSNPSGFNFGGERMANITENINRCLTTVTIEGKNYTMFPKARFYDYKNTDFIAERVFKEFKDATNLGGLELTDDVKSQFDSMFWNFENIKNISEKKFEFLLQAVTIVSEFSTTPNNIPKLNIILHRLKQDRFNELDFKDDYKGEGTVIEQIKRQSMDYLESFFETANLTTINNLYESKPGIMIYNSEQINLKNDYFNFTNDIKIYLTTGVISPTLTILNTEIKQKYGINIQEFTDGLVNVGSLVIDLYLSEYGDKELIEDETAFYLPIKSTGSTIDHIRDIRESVGLFTEDLDKDGNIYLDSFVLIDKVYEYQETFNYIKDQLRVYNKELIELNNQHSHNLTEREYNNLNNKIKELEKQIKAVYSTTEYLNIEPYLKKYYGFTYLSDRPKNFEDFEEL